MELDQFGAQSLALVAAPAGILLGNTSEYSCKILVTTGGKEC
jgi:hypothetical protein